MLIHFKNGYEYDGENIGITTYSDIGEYIKVVKEIGKIHIEGKDYEYVDSVFKPTFNDAFVDCVEIIVRELTYVHKV